MLKKLILPAALVTLFAATTSFTTAAKADSFSVSSDSYALTSLSHLSEATESLSALTKTMNQTVDSVSKAKAQADAQKSADAQAQAAAQAQETTANKIVSTAKQYLGVPYVYGGTTPAGFDCSGFTSYVYQEALGKSIGRTTWAQIANGKKISLSQVQVGDVLVLSGGNHVGIYIGNGQFIHAPKPGESVKITSMSDYQPDYALEF